MFAGGYNWSLMVSSLRGRVECARAPPVYVLGVYAHAHEWIWKPEVDTGSLRQSLLFFDTRSITEPGAH